MSANRNEGEGNKTAAREYNDAQQRFVSDGKVEAAARDAEQALEGPERQELLEAEAIGKSRAAPDPRLTTRRSGGVPMTSGSARGAPRAGMKSSGARPSRS
jgi:hypothetical protein